MIRIPVELGERRYDVLVAPGLLKDAAEHLLPFARNGRLVVVVDGNVAALHLPALKAALGSAGIRTEAIAVAPGEASKSWPSLIALTDRLLALELERGEAIVAFGGGVVGDLAGFAAAILKRGCPLVQIPTTLLAQVDSSVGGKTGINTAAGKNLIGAFHQPRLVLIDPLTLATLPDRERRAGYAEIVKYGLIDNPEFFAWCEANGTVLLARDSAATTHAIAVSVAAKARIVVEDEHEASGRRALLNLGHTFAHALEAEHGYSRALLHGEAVAAGLGLAFRFSVRQGLCPPVDAARVTAHLAEVGLPTDVRSAGVDAPAATLVGHMAHDKKRVHGRLPFLLARGIGETFVAPGVDLADVTTFLDEDTD